MFTRRLGRRKYCRGVDLDVISGETLVVIGRSGGGKSVLLKHIIGLMKPTKGEVLVEGQNIVELERAKALGRAEEDRDTFSKRRAVRFDER